MINHIRTLLINRDGRRSPGIDFPGEEFVPPEYRVKTLSTPLLQTYRLWFGADPDSFMLNYRSRQLLTLVHASPLKDHVTAQDPRVTYWPFRDRQLGQSQTYRPVVTSLVGGETAAVVGEAGQDVDVTGRCFNEWQVEVLSSSTVRVMRRSPPQSSIIYDYTVTESLSSQVPLTGSNYRLMLSNPATAQVYLVRTYARPAREMGTILATLSAFPEETRRAIFGRETTEPFLTYRQLWNSHFELPMRLGAYVLAYCRRVEELG